MGLKLSFFKKTVNESEDKPQTSSGDNKTSTEPTPNTPNTECIHSENTNNDKVVSKSDSDKEDKPIESTVESNIIEPNVQISDQVMGEIPIPTLEDNVLIDTNRPVVTDEEIIGIVSQTKNLIIEDTKREETVNTETNEEKKCLCNPCECVDCKCGQHESQQSTTTVSEVESTPVVESDQNEIKTRTQESQPQETGNQESETSAIPESEQPESQTQPEVEIHEKESQESEHKETEKTESNEERNEVPIESPDNLETPQEFNQELQPQEHN